MLLSDEHSEQHSLLEGFLKGYNGCQAQDQDQGEQEDARGIEMEEDFDGQMQDMPQDPNDDGQDQPEASEDEDAERLEQQMGDVGPEGETVDERMWGPQDEKEEGGTEQEAGQAPVQVSHTVTHTIRGGKCLWSCGLQC